MEELSEVVGGFSGCRAMTDQSNTSISPDRSAAILDEALRRIEDAIPDAHLGALRQALQSELAKRPLSLVKLMKIGRRRALDRIVRMARKDAARANRTALCAPSTIDQVGFD